MEKTFRFSGTTPPTLLLAEALAGLLKQDFAFRSESDKQARIAELFRLIADGAGVSPPQQVQKSNIPKVNKLILQLVDQNPDGTPVEEIKSFLESKEVEISQEALYMRLSRMVQDGLIIRASRGEYAPA